MNKGISRGGMSILDDTIKNSSNFPNLTLEAQKQLNRTVDMIKKSGGRSTTSDLKYSKKIDNRFVSRNNNPLNNRSTTDSTKMTLNSCKCIILKIYK